MHQRVVQFLDENNIIAQTQLGFCTTHLTTDAISKFVRDILNGCEKNYFCLSLFMDLHKAFDCISHSILLEKIEHYGIRDNALNWFKSYLHARIQYVKINDLKNACKYASSLICR